jgi:hypothetical protein
MVDSGFDLRVLYRSDVSGITNDVGVEALARANWNSVSSLSVFPLYLGFNETTSSRHWGVVAGNGL